jgi:cell wall-associated NlpC family hydrolase
MRIRSFNKLAGTAFALLTIVAIGAVSYALLGGFSSAASAKDGDYAITFDGSDSFKTAKTEPAKLERDPEEHLSFPEDKDSARRHRVAELPAASTTTQAEADGASPAELRSELKAARKASRGGGRVTLLSDGTAVAPIDAPEQVQQIVNAANVIAKFPYIWGGGHGSFSDNGYDCSGSISYAFAAAGLVENPLVSGELANWGEAGPGKWVTVYANGGHVFMTVGGLRYDTSFRDGPRGSRWQTASRPMKGFAVRHMPGL